MSVLNIFFLANFLCYLFSSISRLMVTLFIPPGKPFLLTLPICLDQCCWIEISVMTETFLICAVQYGSHWPHVATEHSNASSETQNWSFKFYFILMNLKFK